VIGIDMVGASPTEVANGAVGSRPDACWFRANDVVFAIGFIPDRDDFDALLLG